MSHSTRARVYKGANGRAEPIEAPACCDSEDVALLETFMIGKPVCARLSHEQEHRLCDGIITRLLRPTKTLDGRIVLDTSSVVYIAEYPDAPGGDVSRRLSQDEAEEAHSMHTSVHARFAEMRMMEVKRLRKQKSRAQQAAARGGEEAPSVEESTRNLTYAASPLPSRTA